MLMLLLLVHVTNAYSFISTTSRSSLRTKLGRMIEQHGSALNYHVMMLILSPLDHIADISGFLPTFTGPMTTEFGRMLDQYTLILPCR